MDEVTPAELLASWRAVAQLKELAHLARRYDEKAHAYLETAIQALKEAHKIAEQARS